MKQADWLRQENEALRDRLSRLSRASLRINESLEFDTVLQGVLDSACALTDARYGVITLLDAAGRVQDFLAHGLTAEETQRFWKLTDGARFFQYFSQLQEPLRLRDFHSHTRALGLPEFRPPMAVSSPLPFLAAPMRHRGERIGVIYVGEKEREFTPEDEETLVMFASQAALVIANARRYRDELRARGDLEALVNMSPVGVVVFDARTGGLVSVNREARRIVSDLRTPGVAMGELLDILTFRRADGREFSLAEFPLADMMRAGRAGRSEEIVVEAPDGRSITTLVNTTPIRSGEGELESFVVTLQDLTPLEELERLRSEFLGMVSHELRMPLVSIKGSSTTLLNASSDLDPAEIRQFHRIIDYQADNMRDLIGNLLDVARIETGTLSVNPEPVAIVALVDDARSRFLSGNSLQIDLPPDLPRVMADGRRIVQVLNNLLSNAARHSPEASVIRMSAALEGFHVAVSVSDEGEGVPPDLLPRLFGKFSRMVGDGLGRDLDGSGLGLAICKGIVEAHGGRLWAESKGEGLGARFTFTIPVVEETPAVATAGVPAPLPREESERTRILVVDDDPQTLRYVRDALTKAGYTPSVTADPKDVFDLMEEHDPHLVLIDLMLPESDGIELMTGILAKYAVPVIFLSAYGQDQIIARAFDMGASDYVVKPFSPTELAARIRAALRRRRAPIQQETPKPYESGDLTINYAERLVTIAGRPVPLTALEYRLLVELSVNAGYPLTHERLLRRVWGLVNNSDLRPLRTVVTNLRRKLGDDARNPTYILTESRVGYRMAKGETPDGSE